MSTGTARRGVRLKRCKCMHTPAALCLPATAAVRTSSLLRHSGHSQAAWVQQLRALLKSSQHDATSYAIEHSFCKLMRRQPWQHLLNKACQRGPGLKAEGPGSFVSTGTARRGVQRKRCEYMHRPAELSLPATAAAAAVAAAAAAVAV